MIAKIKRVMKDAHEIINKKDSSEEARRIGTLRAGSTGALLDNGNILAPTCGRLAQARFLGEQQSPTEEMRAMFNGGSALEDFIENRLDAAGITFRKEPSVKGEISEGLVIEGRPDFDIEIGGEWVGIEVKSLASPFSVIKQVKNRFPFIKHLLQAATYCMILNRDRWLVVIGNSFNVNQNGFKVPSGTRWYQLNRVNKQFTVENEKGEVQALPFNESHIVAYYKELKQANEEKRLMARPTEKELNVDTYNRCKYCHMESQCNLYDTGKLDFDTWISRVSLNKEKPNG